jgi:hypothetical protein
MTPMRCPQVAPRTVEPRHPVPQAKPLARFQTSYLSHLPDPQTSMNQRFADWVDRFGPDLRSFSPEPAARRGPLRLNIGARVEVDRVNLVHPIHQQVRVVAWEVRPRRSDGRNFRNEGTGSSPGYKIDGPHRRFDAAAPSHAEPLPNCAAYLYLVRRGEDLVKLFCCLFSKGSETPCGTIHAE